MNAWSAARAMLLTSHMKSLIFAIMVVVLGGCYHDHYGAPHTTSVDIHAHGGHGGGHGGGHHR